MTLNERILDFLDGSLPADDEAELLHTLSVSPEQRTMLRGFIEQRTLLARDAKSLSVPYAAEQRLWARMDQVLPVSEDAGTAIVPLPSSNAGFFARAFSGASAAVGAFMLLAGIGIGYVAWHSQTNGVPSINTSAQVSSVGSASPDLAVPNPSYATHGSYESHGNHRINRATSNIASTQSSAAQNQSAPLVPPSALNSDDNAVPITPVAAVNTPAITPADIGGDGSVVGIKPLLHYVRKPREDNGSLLSRFEFRFDESLGRQSPNNIATAVSAPTLTLTNLSLTTFFQVFPHSDLFWAGLSGGYAYIARKNLFSQSISPSQNVLASDTSSSQTRYGAVLAELRLPAFDRADMTFTAGYGLATLGQMMFGEVGLHFDLSNEAGIQCGLRVLQFTYNLNAEKAEAISASGTSSVSVPNGITSVNPSLNAELNVGFFFHF